MVAHADRSYASHLARAQGMGRSWRRKPVRGTKAGQHRTDVRYWLVLAEA